MKAMPPLYYFNRWLIAALALEMLTAARHRYLSADFPRRHALRERWSRLVETVDLWPYRLADVVGFRVELELAPSPCPPCPKPPPPEPMSINPAPRD